MAISEELEAKILRYYHVEKWLVGTIATQLSIHHGTVERVIAQAGIPKAKKSSRQSIVEPYLPFILETLDKYPKLTASRLYHMVRERGYPGAPDYFRHLISRYRPRPSAEAYLRLKVLPGEQAQVDWGHFGKVSIGKAMRPLMAFVMVLSYSRKIFLRFYLNQRMANFLRGHEAAFNAWGGLPRVLLYDNLKSAVLERQGDAIRFHPTMLAFASHYRFEPRPVAVARGNEKGRVERAIRYIRDSFFAGREWKDLDDLNAQAMDWCNGQASDRPCPEDKALSVQATFEREQPKLLSLPANPYPVDEREEVKISKTPYARFDLNDYSLPYRYVRRVITVIGTLNEVSILDGSEVIARHKRSYDKGQQIEDDTHIAALVEHKKKARQHRGQDKLAHAVPSSVKLLVEAATKGNNIGSITASLLRLLDEYGASELELSVKEALERKVPHSNAVRISLEKRRKYRQKAPPLPITLPKDNRAQELVVRPHSLNDYDKLKSPQETEKDEDR